MKLLRVMFAGRNIYRQLFARKLPERNELFLPGRMAYVVDLEDDFTDSDIPTTLIRSKADCPSLEVIDSHCLLTHPLNMFSICFTVAFSVLRLMVGIRKGIRFVKTSASPLILSAVIRRKSPSATSC